MIRSSVGGMSAIAGVILLFVGTYLHPLGADPNDVVAAFTEYAAEIAGITMAYTGFSGPAMAISMPASSILLVWMLSLGVLMWRRGGSGPDNSAG